MDTSNLNTQKAVRTYSNIRPKKLLNAKIISNDISATIIPPEELINIDPEISNQQTIEKHLVTSNTYKNENISSYGSNESVDSRNCDSFVSENSSDRGNMAQQPSTSRKASNLVQNALDSLNLKQPKMTPLERVLNWKISDIFRPNISYLGDKPTTSKNKIKTLNKVQSKGNEFIFVNTHNTIFNTTNSRDSYIKKRDLQNIYQAKDQNSSLNNLDSYNINSNRNMLLQSIKPNANCGLIIEDLSAKNTLISMRICSDDKEKNIDTINQNENNYCDINKMSSLSKTDDSFFKVPTIPINYRKKIEKRREEFNSYLQLNPQIKNCCDEKSTVTDIKRTSKSSRFFELKKRRSLRVKIKENNQEVTSLENVKVNATPENVNPECIHLTEFDKFETVSIVSQYNFKGFDDSDELDSEQKLTAEHKNECSKSEESTESTTTSPPKYMFKKYIYEKNNLKLSPKISHSTHNIKFLIQNSPNIKKVAKINKHIARKSARSIILRLSGSFPAKLRNGKQRTPPNILSKLKTRKLKKRKLELNNKTHSRDDFKTTENQKESITLNLKNINNKYIAKQVLYENDNLEYKFKKIEKNLSCEYLTKDLSKDLMENSKPNLISSNETIALYYDEQHKILMAVQTKVIQLFKYRKLVVLFGGAASTWASIGSIERKHWDYEIPTQYQKKFNIYKSTIVYAEVHAQSKKSTLRECPFSSVYVNVYFSNSNFYELQMHSVQFDVIQCEPEEICYTITSNTIYFIMSWVCRLLDSTKYKVRKYGLTSEFDMVYGVMDFSDPEHKINSILQINENTIIGFGDQVICLWDLNSGDLNICIDMKIPIGLNLTGYIQEEDGEKYMLLIQIVNSELGLLSIKMDSDFKFKFIQTYPFISNNNTKPYSTSKLSNMILSLFHDKFLVVNLNNLENIYIKEIPKNPELKTFIHGDYVIEVGNSITVKSITEYILNVNT